MVRFTLYHRPRRRRQPVGARRGIIHGPATNHMSRRATIYPNWNLKQNNTKNITTLYIYHSDLSSFIPLMAVPRVASPAGIRLYIKHTSFPFLSWSGFSRHHCDEVPQRGRLKTSARETLNPHQVTALGSGRAFGRLPSWRPQTHKQLSVTYSYSKPLNGNNDSAPTRAKAGLTTFPGLQGGERVALQPT